MKNRSINILILLIILIALFLIPQASIDAASKADKAIKTSKRVYNKVSEKVDDDKLKVVYTGKVRDYYEDDILRKTECLSTRNDLSPKNCMAEYFYDSNNHPVFIYAWKKVNGEIREYRAYYGKDGKCYRYIGPDHIAHTYKKGRSRDHMPSMARNMFLKAQRNLYLLGYL